jgi:hypothetical protein
MSHLKTIHLGSSIASGVCKESEYTLNCILNNFKNFCSEYIQRLGINATFHWQKSIKVSDVVKDYENDKCFMSPDGGLFFINIGACKYCFMIVEDKYQGTNDLRYSQGLKKQGTGNAIERVFKNLNASWHLFKDLPISPYLVFIAGCDFHSSESIIHRIGPLSNFGKKPIVWEMTKDSSFDVPKMTEKIDVKKDINREFATFCVKTHKYDEFPNKSSMWTPNERMEIMKHVAKQALKEIILYHNSDDKLCSTTYDNIHR